MVDRGEPVAPWEHPGHVRVHAWVTGHWKGPDRQRVTVGSLPDGRWFVELASRLYICQAYRDRETAERSAAQVRAAYGTDWRAPSGTETIGGTLHTGPTI